MPPHLGHQYLIDFAHNFCGDVTVFLCSLSSEPIPGEIRLRWLEHMVPYVHVVHITEEIPEAARDQDGAYAIWARAVRERMDHDPRYVFASEEYGRPLATELGARFVPVDPQRGAFPVSAGMIRENPHAHWRFIPPVVRPWYAKKVVALDADGTLGRDLAHEFTTLFVADYAAHAATLGVGVDDGASVRDLLYAQLASEAAVLPQTAGFVVTNANAAALLDLVEDSRERERLSAELERQFRHFHPDLVVGEAGTDGIELCEQAGWPTTEVESRAEAVEAVRTWASGLTKS
jgi:NadR type nicotinamide-nucleotide adenylyltransferase